MAGSGASGGCGPFLRGDKTIFLTIPRGGLATDLALYSGSGSLIEFTDMGIRTIGPYAYLIVNRSRHDCGSVVTKPMPPVRPLRWRLRLNTSRISQQNVAE